MRIFGFARKQYRQLRDWAQSTRVYRAGTPLAAVGNGEYLAYAINDVYLETGQGNASPMRGFGAIVFALGVLGSSFGLYVASEDFIGPMAPVHLSAFSVFGDILGVVMLLPVLLFALFGALAPFLTATDPLVRYDRKRQKVWIWTTRDVISIDWAKLTPCVYQSVASATSTIHIHSGLFAELGPDGLPVVTAKMPHMVRCGEVSAIAEGVLQSMEFVRSYMATSGPPPRVERLLQRRPKWWAMVNFFGLAQAWIDWKANRDRPGLFPPPLWGTLFAIVGFPLMFPLQVTNWLALRVARMPKWPAELVAMHEADLAELAHGKRKPVIRLNGEIVPGVPADRS